MAPNNQPLEPRPPLPKTRIVDDKTRVRKIDDRAEGIYRHDHHQTYQDGKNLNLKSVKRVGDIVTKVGDELVDCALKYAADSEHSTKFMPRTAFDKIITPEVVFQIVRELQCYKGLTKDQCIDRAKGIYYGTSSGHPPCKRLLATLVIMNSADNMETYISDGISDTCLPFVVHDDENKHNLSCRLHQGKDGHAQIKKTGKKWRIDFTTWSRSVLSPYVIWEEKGLHCHFIMQGGGPLPMAPVMGGDKEQVVLDGGFGEIYKVVLQGGDRSFDDEGRGVCCIKLVPARISPLTSRFIGR